MSLFRASLDPTPRQLRQFGLCGLVALPLLGWMLTGWSLPGTWSGAAAAWFTVLAAAGCLLGLLALGRPAALRPIFIAASIVTIPIGIVIGEVLMAAIYFVIVTPVALWFRLIGRDALSLRFDAGAPTYWTPRRQEQALDYYRQS